MLAFFKYLRQTASTPRLSFDLDTEKGAEFFRSSLIQTAYYGLFAGWTLWQRAQEGTPFQWVQMDNYLKIPFLGKLFCRSGCSRQAGASSGMPGTSSCSLPKAT